MLYTSLPEIKVRFPLEEVGITLEEAHKAMTNAEHLVDGYLRGLYVLPLEGDIDPLLNYVASELAFGLMEEVGSAQHSFFKVRALNLLEDIRTGKVVLTHHRCAEGGLVNR